jgi:hypothetical protein
MRDSAKVEVKRGFIKIHVTVNVKTKQIISMGVTKEEVSDGKILKPLVEEASTKAEGKKVTGDGQRKPSGRQHTRLLALQTFSEKAY